VYTAAHGSNVDRHRRFRGEKIANIWSLCYFETGGCEVKSPMNQYGAPWGQPKDLLRRDVGIVMRWGVREELWRIVTL
jgi:hypothetical protein